MKTIQLELDALTGGTSFFYIKRYPKINTFKGFKSEYSTP